MINIEKERVLSLTEAAKLPILPRRRRGRRTSVQTLYRWASSGCRGVKLEVVRVGGTLCTSVEALQRFFETLTCGGTEPASRATATVEKHVLENRLRRHRIAIRPQVADGLREGAADG